MNKAEIIAADALARTRIMTETDKNFFVEASAGSGKTTSLVARMVAMVKNGVDIKSIAAITYTKAAAKEFYIRFQKSLDKERKTAVDEAVRTRCENALVDIDLCFLGTIDAFCNKILSSYPVEAGVPMDARVLSDEELHAAYRREWLSMKRGGYGSELQRLYSQFEKYQTRPDEVFDCAIKSFLDTRRSVRSCVPFSDCDIDEYFEEEKREIVSIAQHILEHSEAQKRGVAQTKKLDTLKKTLALLDESWSANVMRLLAALNNMDNIHLTVDPALIGITNTEYFQYPAGRARDFVLMMKEEGSVYRRLKELQYSATVEMLDKFSIAAAERLKSKGELNFFDYILYLRELLKKDIGAGGQLIDHISCSYRYFLIDEFQDTNPLQAEIFFYLTAQKPDADWQKCVPRPGSLFIVGDPKQSIYRFSGADVTSFLRVKSLFTGEAGEVLYLYRNFRSCLKMRAWFNTVFASLLPVTSEYQSAFSEIPENEGDAESSAEEEGNILEGVYKYASGNGDDAVCAAEIIGRMIGNNSCLLRDRGELRQIVPGDIMLITRTKSHLDHYMSELAARGIPFFIEGKTTFRECPALVALSNVICALAFPSDGLSVYAALKCGSFAVTDADIVQWREQGGKLSLFDGKDREGAVSEALSQMLYVRNIVRSLPAPVIALKVSEALELPIKAGTDKLEYFYFAIELLRQAQAEGNAISLPDTARFLQELLNTGREREMSLVQQTSGVHIANLHKVKGLEAPIVILADPRKFSRSPERSTVRNGSEITTVFFKIGKPGGVTYAETYRQSDALEEEARRLSAEEQRLKYVAATRAGNALVIATQENEELASNTWLEFLPFCHRTLRLPDIQLQSPRSEQESVDIAQVRSAAAQFRADMSAAGRQTYIVSRPSLLKTKSKASAEDEYDDMLATDIEAASRRRHAALIGTMIHRMMELLVSCRGSMSAEEVTASVISEYDVFGELGEQIESVILRAAERMKNGGFPQSNGLPQDLLAELSSAQSVMCETPLCVFTSKPEYMLKDLPTLLHGIIDLAYEKDGCWHIIDYKTSVDPDDLDEHYALQLASYAYGFELVTGYKADARVYHIEA